MQDRKWSEVPRALTVTPDWPDITTQWRCFWPSMELAGHGYIADYCRYSELNQFIGPLKYGRYNILVTPRQAFLTHEDENDWMAIFNILRDKVVWFYESDDDLWSPEFIDRQLDVNKFYYREEERKKLEFIRQSGIRMLRAADAVTVASPKLVELAQALTDKPVYFVPNGINARAYTLASDIQRTIPPLTIGWSGGPRLERDLEPLYEVWPKVAQARPDVHFVLQGWVPPKMVGLIDASRLHCSGGVPAEQYPAELKNIDIFCCVAGSDPWCEAKSPIKYLEATLTGATCVVSDKVYGPLLDNYAGGLVADHPDEWFGSILELIDDANFRKQIHANALKLVLDNHTTRQTYKLWLDAWSNALR